MAKQDPQFENWKGLRPRVKERWHALSDDDLGRIDGSRAVLTSVLCERYAYTDEQARRQVQRFLDEISVRTPA